MRGQCLKRLALATAPALNSVCINKHKSKHHAEHQMDLNININNNNQNCPPATLLQSFSFALLFDELLPNSFYREISNRSQSDDITMVSEIII